MRIYVPWAFCNLRLLAEALLFQNAAMFFGIPAQKDERGSEAYAEDGIVQRAFRKAKKEFLRRQLLLRHLDLRRLFDAGKRLRAHRLRRQLRRFDYDIP